LSIRIFVKEKEVFSQPVAEVSLRTVLTSMLKARTVAQESLKYHVSIEREDIATRLRRDISNLTVSICDIKDLIKREDGIL